MAACQPDLSEDLEDPVMCLGKITPRIVRKFKVSFLLPRICTTPRDNVVLCEYFGRQVHVYSPGGYELVQFPTPAGTDAWGVYYTANNILVADDSTKSILVFNIIGATCTYSRSIRVRSADCSGVCVEDDRLYVMSGSENKVYQLHWPSGSSKQVFAQHTSEVPLKRPRFVAATSTHVAVSCEDSKLVQVFDTSGKLDYTYSGQGSPRGLGSPRGVAIDCEGTLFVSDSHNHCIHIISCQGRFIGLIDLGKNDLGKNDRGRPGDVAINSFKREVVVVIDCGDHSSVVTYTFIDTD